MASLANAAYIEVVDVGKTGRHGDELTWKHSYDVTQFANIESVQLTIVAYDVDPKNPFNPKDNEGERDRAYVNNYGPREWLTQSNSLEYLTQMDNYTNGIIYGPGGVYKPEYTTTSIFDLDPKYLAGTMDFGVKVDKSWEVVIVSSTLTVTGANPVPVPASAILFGTGLAGLVGIARRRGKVSAA